MPSTYYDDERPRRSKSHHGRSRVAEYDEEDYRPAAKESRNTRMDLVRSPRRPSSESVSSVEEVQRDFPPGDRSYERTTRIRKGVRPVRSSRPMSSRFSDDESYFSDPRDRPRRTTRRYYEEDRRDRRSRRYDSSSESSQSRSPPRRRKSVSDKALSALGLGGLAGVIAGQSGDKRDRSRDKDRHSDRYSDRSRSRSRAGGRRRDRRSSSSSRSRSRSREANGSEKIAQAMKAALAAGAAEAFRARKEPGGWAGQKGKRILTAAISAGGIDGLVDKDPDKHGKRHVLGSALAGLATNRVINGPRSKSRGPNERGRNRSRSQSRGGVGDLAAGGVLAATGKKIYDRVRSKSRGRERERSRSSSFDSRDSRSPPPKEKKRSRSVSAFASKGLAALGLNDAAKKLGDRDRRRDSSSSDEDYSRSRPRGGAYADNRDVSRSRPSSLSRGGGGAHTDLVREPHHHGDPETDSDSDLGSSTDEDKEIKKGHGKELLTAGLATVATIHAGHSVYQSMKARDKRKKELHTGEITQEEAKKERNKARLQDAASIGIAALGVKGAFSEWKEVKEKREEIHELKEKQKRHHAKREARRRKQLMGQGVYGGSEPSLPTNSAMAGNGYPPSPYSPYGPRPETAGGPTYFDGNPYASGALQTPPSGPPPNGVPPPPGAPPPGMGSGQGHY
ncbi:MAG: hypothetical protein Q9227_007172 [Pyrenula ochraceoflavens]